MLRFQVTKSALSLVLNESGKDRDAFIARIMTRARSEDPLLWHLIETLSHSASIEMRELGSPHADVVKRIVEEVGAYVIASISHAEKEGVHSDGVKTRLMGNPDHTDSLQKRAEAERLTHEVLHRFRRNQ